MQSIKIKNGRFAGKDFLLEADIRQMPGCNQLTDLPSLAMTGNYAAANALTVDNYRAGDAPFYYGKIGALGYIVSHFDLYGVKKS